MECWNIGLGGIRSVFIVLADIKKIEIDRYPLLIPNIPFFHHSILFYYFMGYLTTKTTP
jgi:hypothetical protein